MILGGPDRAKISQTMTLEIPAINPYLADIERSLGGSDAPRVVSPVRGDVLDLAARSADIH
jgi:hypothetical protein